MMWAQEEEEDDIKRYEFPDSLDDEPWQPGELLKQLQGYKRRMRARKGR